MDCVVTSCSVDVETEATSVCDVEYCMRQEDSGLRLLELSETTVLLTVSVVKKLYFKYNHASLSITFLNLKKADPTKSIIHVQCTCNFDLYFYSKNHSKFTISRTDPVERGQYCKILICYQEILLMFDYYNTYVNAVPKKSMNSYKFHGTDIYHFIELNAFKASIYNYTFLYEN